MSNVLLILAGRNLWRQKRRTLLTCLAIAFGIFMLIFLDSLLGGFDESGTKNLIDLQTGHLQIMSQEQFDAKNLTLDHLFVPEPHWETFNNLPGVEGAAGRIFFPVRLNTGWEEYSVVGVGIDPEQDPRVFDLPTYLHGQWLAPGEGGMLLGRRTAELLDLEIGDYLTAVTRTADGAFQALDFQLVGILATPHPQLDQGMAFFPMDVIDEGLALRGQISEISLRVEPGRLGDVQRAVGSLIASRSELAVYTWEESAAEFLAIGESKRGFQLILLLLIALIALVGVVNTVLLASLERTREIGMLKALGMGEGEIIKTFVFESLGIGLLGSLLGCLLAVLVNLYMTHIGVDFTPFFGDLDIGYPVQGRVFGIWNWPLFVTAFSFGVVVSALAGVLPALGAAKKDPIWALRQ